MQRRRGSNAVRAADGYGAGMRNALPVAAEMPNAMQALLKELERRLADDDRRQAPLKIRAEEEKRGG